MDVFGLLTCFKCERLVLSNYNNELTTEDTGFIFWLCRMLDMSPVPSTAQFLLPCQMILMILALLPRSVVDEL